MKTQMLGIQSAPHHSRFGRVNTRLVLILTIALLVSGTVIHFVHGVMVDRNAHDLYDRAVRLLAEAKTEEPAAELAEGQEREKLTKQVAQKRDDAIRYLGQYVQLNTDDYKAWLLYAESSDEFQTAPAGRRKVQERLNAALRKLESANDAGEASDEDAQKILPLRRRAIEVSMQVGLLSGETTQFKVARQEIEELSKKLPDDAELRLWAGICEFQLDNWNAAAQEYDRAIALDPSLVDAYRNLMMVINDHPSDVNFQGFDPENKPEPTAEDVVRRLGEKLVRNGKPAYQAYYTAATLEQKRSADALNDESRDSALARARLLIDDSVKKLDQLIAQPEESADETAKSAATDISPLLAASNIYATSASNAREQSDMETADAYTAKAHEYVNLAHSRQPSNLYCYLMLSKIEQSAQFAKPVSEQDWSASIQLLKDGIAQVPESQQFPTHEEWQLRLELAEQMIRAKYWQEGPGSAEKQQELEDAFAMLKERNVPTNFVDFTRAMQLYEQGDWQPAIAALDDARDRLIDVPHLSLRINMMLANCYAQTGNSQLQLRALERAKEIAPLNVALRFQLASALARAGRVDNAISEMNAAKNIRVDGVAAAIAQLSLIKMLELPAPQRNWDALREALKNLLGALDQVDRKFSPDWTAINVALAHTFTNNAAELIDTQADQAARMQMLDAAEALLRKAIEEQPEEIAYWPELTNVQFLRGIFNKDENEKRRLQTEALDVLDQASAKFGNLPVLRTTRARALAMMHNNEDDPADVLKQINALGDDLEGLDDRQKIHLWRGLSEASLRLASIENARRYRQKIVDLEPYNLDYQLVLFQMVTSDVNRLFRDVTPDLPVDKLTELRNQYAEDRQQAAEIVATIRDIEGNDGPNGNFAEATALLLDVEFAQRQLADRRGVLRDAKLAAKLERARRLLAAAESQQPRQAKFSATLGRVEATLNHDQAAIDHLLRAVELGDLDPNTLDHLIPLLSRFNRNDEIRDIVQRIQRRQPEMLTSSTETGFGSRMGEYAMQAAVRQGDYDSAVELIGKITPDGDTNYNYQLRIGQINLMQARANQNVAQATNIEQYFRKAVELAPKEPKVWFALVSYLIEAGRGDEARQEVENGKLQLAGDDTHLLFARLNGAVGNQDEATREYEAALRQTPADPVLVSELIDYYLSLKNVAAAETALNAALSLAPDNLNLDSAAANLYAKTGQRDRAIKHLKKIIDQQPEFDTPLVKSARRRMALLMGATNVYKESLEALDEIDKNLVDERNLDDLRVKVEILNRHATQAAQLELIEILNEIDRTGQLSLRERFVLAKLYQVRGEWDAAKGHMLDLVDSSPETPLYLAEYIDGLTKQGQLGDAAAFINKLEQMAPGSMTLAVVKARLHMARDQPDAAAKELTEFLDKHPAPKYNLELATRIGELYKTDPQPTDELLDVFEEFTKSTDAPQASEALKKARELHSEQKSADAARLATAFAGKIVAQGDLYAEETLAAAKILETLATKEKTDLNQEIIDAAGEVYERYPKLSRKPHAKFVLAGFYGRQKRISEALEISDSLNDGSVPEDQLIAMKVALLRTGFATPEEVRRVAQDVDNAVAENPTSIPLILQLATLRDYQERDDEAVKAYELILKHDPDNVMANNNLAWLLAMRTGENQNTAAALKHIDKAIDVRGPVPEFLDTRATVYMMQQDYPKAIVDLEVAIKSTADNKSMYFHLAQAHKNNGDFTEAKRTMARALRMGFTPNDLHPREVAAYDELIHDLGLSAEKN